jgi:hypothetical protein
MTVSRPPGRRPFAVLAALALAPLALCGPSAAALPLHPRSRRGAGGNSSSPGPRRLSGARTVYVDCMALSLRLVSAVSSSYVLSAWIFVAWEETAALTAKGLVNDGDEYVPLASDFVPAVTLPLKIAATVEGPAYFVNKGTPEWTGAAPPDANALWVTGSMLVTGTFLQAQSLRDFPFDTQDMVLSLESDNADADMVFASAPFAAEDFIPPADVDGFTTRGAFARVDTASYPSIGFSSSRLQLGLTLERKPSFYLFRFIFPLTLVMIMVFATPSLALGRTDRFSPAFTGFSATVTFLFVASNSVPQLSYLTRLDMFFALNFISCAAVWLSGLMSYVAADRLKAAAAEARASNGGRLALCCAPRGARAAPAPLVIHVGGTKVAAGAEHNAGPGKGDAAAGDRPPPATFFALALKGFNERLDLGLSSLFAAAYLVAAAIILKAPVAKAQ